MAALGHGIQIGSGGGGGGGGGGAAALHASFRGNYKRWEGEWNLR